MCVTAASGGALLFTQYAPFAILKVRPGLKRRFFLDLKNGIAALIYKVKIFSF
jgi:hypothetical protein